MKTAALRFVFVGHSSVPMFTANPIYEAAQEFYVIEITVKSWLTSVSVMQLTNPQGIELG
jgi:hypothetical protein